MPSVIDNPKTKPKPMRNATSVYLSPRVREAIDRIAKAERRSRSAQCEIAVMEWLTERAKPSQK